MSLLYTEGVKVLKKIALHVALMLLPAAWLIWQFWLLGGFRFSGTAWGLFAGGALLLAQVYAGLWNWKNLLDEVNMVRMAYCAFGLGFWYGGVYVIASFGAHVAVSTTQGIAFLAALIWVLDKLYFKQSIRDALARQTVSHAQNPRLGIE